MGIGEVVPLTYFQCCFVIVDIFEPTGCTVGPDFNTVCGIHAEPETDMPSCTVRASAANNCVRAWQPVQLHPCGLCDCPFKMKGSIVCNDDVICGSRKLECFAELSVDPCRTTHHFTFKSVWGEVLCHGTRAFIERHV